MGRRTHGVGPRASIATTVLAVLLLACSADPGDSGDPNHDSQTPDPASPGSTTTPAELPSSPATAAEPPPEPEPTPITMAFAGDIHFEGALGGLLSEPDTALDPIADRLSAADLTVVNLETAIMRADRPGQPEPEKRFRFRAPPSALRALGAAGVDVVTLANNHALDFGPAGVTDAIAASEAVPDLSVVGIGTGLDEAFAPAVHDVGGTMVAVLGASMADDPTADPTAHWAATDDEAGIAVVDGPDRLVESVNRARSEADVVVVYLHWGVQGDHCPSPAQQELAEQLAAAGADAVVGSHAHVLQGAGFLDDTYVAYGLGNFSWYNPSTTGLLTLTVDGLDGVRDANWDPARIGDDGLPEFASGDDARELSDNFADLRECTNLTP